MKKEIAFAALALLLASCQNSSNTQAEEPQTQEANVEEDTYMPNDLSVENEQNEGTENHEVTLWEVDLPDGKHRKFNQIISPAYKLIAIDQDKETIIPTPYDRYHDGYDFYEEGAFDPFHYTTSPDHKYLYVTTAIHANGSGWINEYQLFRINAQTLECKMIADCAAIKVTRTGFTIAECRIVNEETAEYSVDQIYKVHDVHLNWEGTVTRIEKEEYDPQEVTNKRYPPTEDEWTTLVGFMRKE